MKSAQILLVSKERSALDLPWTGSGQSRLAAGNCRQRLGSLERVQCRSGPDLILLDLMRR